MAAAAKVTVRDRRRGNRTHVAIATEEDGEEQHLNPFLDVPSSATSKVQFRKVASRARWIEEAGVAEVVDNKGKMWLTTGVTRVGKLYYNIEEIGFLIERGALVLLDDKDEAIGIEYIYEKIVGGNYGCCWNGFQVYKQMKSLGYIVGRYGVPWTMNHSDNCYSVPAPKNMISTNWDFITADGTCNDITNWFKKMQIDRTSPCFQVYLPNSKFKKSSTGVPSFLMCLLRDKPPSKIELETVENKFEGIHVKYCHVDNGRVSFLSFDEVTLPTLP